MRRAQLSVHTGDGDVIVMVVSQDRSTHIHVIGVCLSEDNAEDAQEFGAPDRATWNLRTDATILLENICVA